MATFKCWRSFWWEIVKMWTKEHGVTLNLVWKLGPFLTIIGLLGIITLDGFLLKASLAILSVGVFSMFFSFCCVFPYKKWEKDTAALKQELDRLAPLNSLEREQRGHEEDWLHPFIEYIDLEKRTNAPEKQIVVKFNVDSGLVYDFKPYRLWVTPVLDGYVPSEAQYEVTQPPNFLRGQRSQQASIAITIKDDKLWAIVEAARKREKVTKKELKIDMILEVDKSISTFRVEATS